MQLVLGSYIFCLKIQKLTPKCCEILFMDDNKEKENAVRFYFYL